MRFTILLTVLAFAGRGAPVSTGTESIVVLVGPGSADTARRTAQGVASAVQKVLGRLDSTVELMPAGSGESLAIEAGWPSRRIQQAVSSAVALASGADAGAVAVALDRSAQMLMRRPGRRVLIAIIESQPVSSEVEAALVQLADYCRDHAVRILLVDQAVTAAKKPAAVYQKLAEATGGAYIHSAKAIGSTLVQLTALPSTGQGGDNEARAPAPAAAGLLPMPDAIPVRIRFIRTTTERAISWGTERSYSSGGGPSGGGIQTTEGGPNREGGIGPARGMLLVEAPLSGLEFLLDDNSGVYTARARVTQVVRDGRGREVWRAHKDVTLRSKRDRLDERRSGNLYYMRDVTLPGGRYTLEATVEDLLAHKTGGVREPLGTSMGLPGFNVSDAVIVRPFKGSVDRFDADQIFSYDGDALSPLLDPVFKADQPSTLQIYFVIYPDLRGGRPEISLEILQSGRVVGRKAIPFTDSLMDSSREGIGAMKGEQKHQFPYLATLRGIKFTPGDFEARITVRQNRNVLVRSVSFRVSGPGRQGMEVARGPAEGAAAPLPAADEDEDVAALVLPELDPVDISRSGPSMPAVDQARLWEETALRARDFSDRLPSFRCNQETRRLVASIKKPDDFKVRDLIVDQLTYEDGKESYRTIEVNGLKTDRPRRADDGVNSRGEFGTMLRGVFSPAVAAKYTWAGRTMAAGGLCSVFEIEVPPERSNFVLSTNSDQALAGYKGRIFIDEESGFVRRITIQGEHLPKKFPLQSPALSLEYGMVRIGEQDYLLPLRSVLQVRKGKTLVRNETVFRDYHKFEASSTIRFQP